MKPPGTWVDFYPDDLPRPVPQPSFAHLPAPDPDISKDEQREAFCTSHGGPRSVAEADFESWWRAHRGD